jgi:hypothetical protein
MYDAKFHSSTVIILRTFITKQKILFKKYKMARSQSLNMPKYPSKDMTTKVMFIKDQL